MMYNFKKMGREGPGANFIILINKVIGRQFAGFKRSPFLKNKLITPDRKEMGKCQSPKEKFKTDNKSGAKRLQNER